MVKSIVGWEIVLANGTIANIDAAKNPDLAVALRGSGSQFGELTNSHEGIDTSY